MWYAFVLVLATTGVAIAAPVEFKEPKINNRTVDGCLESPAFSKKNGADCQAKAVEFIAQNFCHLKGYIKAADWKTSQDLSSLKKSYKLYSANDKSDWREIENSTVAFNSIKCDVLAATGPKWDGALATKNFSSSGKIPKSGEAAPTTKIAEQHLITYEDPLTLPKTYCDDTWIEFWGVKTKGVPKCRWSFLRNTYYFRAYGINTDGLSTVVNSCLQQAVAAGVIAGIGTTYATGGGGLEAAQATITLYIKTCLAARATPDLIFKIEREGSWT